MHFKMACISLALLTVNRDHFCSLTIKKSQETWDFVAMVGTQEKDERIGQDSLQPRRDCVGFSQFTFSLTFPDLITLMSSACV